MLWLPRFPSLWAAIVFAMTGLAVLCPSVAAQEKRAAKGKGETKLTPNQIKWLDERVLPAQSLGNFPAVATLIREILPKTSPAVREAIDRELEERQANSLERMLTDARLNVLRSGAPNVLPPPSVQEVPLLSRELRRQVDELLEDASSQPIFADPLPEPETLREARDFLWSAHVLNNTLRNAAYLSTQAQSLLSSAPGARPKNDKKGAAPPNETVAQFVETKETAARLHRDLSERAFEMRLRRIALSLKVLENSADLGERFLAAYAVGVDGDQVQMILKTPRTQPFARESLNEPELASRVNSQVDRAKMQAGDLILKARQLFAGLHWWRRGRYGRGPEHFGLVKFAAALNNPAANIALVMPLDAPQPLDPTNTEERPCPEYDRRHHAWWSWENMKFDKLVTDSSTSYEQTTEVTNRKLGHFDGFIKGTFW